MAPANTTRTSKITKVSTRITCSSSKGTRTKNTLLILLSHTLSATLSLGSKGHLNMHMHTPNHSPPQTLSCARALFPLALCLPPSLPPSLPLSLSLSYFSELETRTPLRSAAVSESSSAAASVTTSLHSTARTQRGHAAALPAAELKQKQGVPMYNVYIYIYMYI